MKNIDPEAFTRLLHAAHNELKRADGLHGPLERCLHCGHETPCVNLNEFLVPYDRLPGEQQKKGLVVSTALLAALQAQTHPLTNVQIAELLLSLKEKIVHERNDGSHGPNKTCPECFEHFPDACPKLAPWLGIKFEDLPGRERRLLLAYVSKIRRILEIEPFTG